MHCENRGNITQENLKHEAPAARIYFIPTEGWSKQEAAEVLERIKIELAALRKSVN